MMTGKELKQIRVSLGLSTRDVADMTFMARRQIYEIEHEKAAKRNYLYLELFYDDYRRKLLFGS